MKKGFTLVEVISIIVILSVVLVIAVPKIVVSIEDRKKTIYNNIISSVEDAAKSYIYMNTAEIDNSISEDGIYYVSLSTLNNKGLIQKELINPITKEVIPNSDRVSIEKEKSKYIIKYVGKNYTCLEKELHGAFPRLDEGMIPVVISNTGEVRTISPGNCDWYNYKEKKWANVVLVKTEGIESREFYKNSEDKVVNPDDILAYFVWIPRYRYKLFNTTGMSASYNSSGVCTSNCPSKIEIIFESANSEKSLGDENGEWLTHPGFTFNNKELNGLWVGKFETTGDTTNTTILPNKKSLTNTIIGSQFLASFNFNGYGLKNSNSRMAKNSDWGAVAYLTNSIYGRCTENSCSEVRINNNFSTSSILTGCGSTSSNFSSSYSSSCTNAFGSGISDYPQTTTNNISGIFDMAGGASEYIMGMLEGSLTVESILGFAGNIVGGVLGMIGIGGSSSNSKINPIYYKEYTTTNWVTNINYLGDALGETQKWYNGINTFVSPASSQLIIFATPAQPVFLRGGSAKDTKNACIYAFNKGDGTSSNVYSFRVVIS